MFIFSIKNGVFILLILLSSSFAATADQAHDEKWYVNDWCSGTGQVEFILPDRTRCDCLTDTHAIEFDFASKFYEAIGQSLYYSMQTGKRAGVVLIIENKADYRYWERLNSVIEHHQLPIDTWATGAGSL